MKRNTNRFSRERGKKSIYLSPFFTRSEESDWTNIRMTLFAISSSRSLSSSPLFLSAIKRCYRLLLLGFWIQLFKNILAHVDMWCDDEGGKLTNHYYSFLLYLFIYGWVFFLSMCFRKLLTSHLKIHTSYGFRHST